MVKGRSLESKGWSLESSQRAKRVSIRSNISSISASDFAGVPEVDDDDDDSAISCSFSNQENKTQKRVDNSEFPLPQVKQFEESTSVRLMGCFVFEQWASIGPFFVHSVIGAPTGIHCRPTRVHFMDLLGSELKRDIEVFSVQDWASASQLKLLCLIGP